MLSLHVMAVDYGRLPSEILEQSLEDYTLNLAAWRAGADQKRRDEHKARNKALRL